MKVIFVDFDGTMLASKANSYFINNPGSDIFFPYEDKFKILSEICKKYDLKVVLSASIKLCSYYTEDENGDILESEHPGITAFRNLCNKYGIEFYGITPSVPNPERDFGSKMWKDYDIQEYLIEHPEITEYVILDDAIENDIDLLKNHLVQTKWIEEGYDDGGLLPHHVDEVQEKLSPREDVIPEKMEDNSLYKSIKYSDYDVQDFQSFGLYISGKDVKVHISLSFDKSTVFYHWYDQYDSKRGVIHNYDEFIKLMNYLEIDKKNKDIKKLEKKM